MGNLAWIDAFELSCWRRLLRVLWTARRANQSILKEISPGTSLEGMMLKLKLQSSCEELTHWKRLWCWEGLGAGGEGNDRGRQWCWMASLTWWTWVWVNSGSWWWTGRPGVLQFMGSQRAGHDWETELNWTDSKNAVPSSIVLRIIFRVHSDALSSLFNRWSYAEGYLPIFLFVQIVPQIIELNLKANHLYLLHLFLF